MIAGVDEAGRGPVIGPLVVVGIAVENDAELKALGVRDSKKLAPKRRQALAVKIRGLAEVEVRVLPAMEIDLLRDDMTMNELEARLFGGVLDALKPDTAYLDAADVREEEFGRMVLSGMECRPRVVSKHGADDTYLVVSAASIIAKVTRDEEVERISRELGASVGSGYPSDPTTISFLENWIKEKGDLPPHTRRSWKTAKRLLSGARTARLDSFGT